MCRNYPTHKPRAFYFPEGRREVPECAIELWRGFFQSVRPTMFGMMVNIDTTMTAVYKSGPMIDIAMTLLGLRNVADLRLTEREANFHKLKEYFVGRRVTTETTGQKTKTIYGLVSAPVGRIKFSLKDGREMSIEVGGSEIFVRQLRYGSLFGVRLSPVEVTDAIIVPPEICSLKPGQFYRKKLTSTATRTAVAFATQRPGDRMKTISQGVAVNNGVVRSPVSDLFPHLSSASDTIVQLQGYGQSPYVLDAQMSISTAAVEISATLFKAPKLESQSAQITPTNGSWNILGHKFKKAETLNSWVLINYDAHHIRERDIQATAEALIKACVKLGMKVNPDPLVRIGNPQNPEEVLDAVYAYAYSIQRQIDLIVVLLPSKAEEIRYRVKHWGDTKYGIRTSCLREEKLMPNLRRPDDNQYLNNVAIKLNARLGGHYVLPITTCLERIKQEPFMVLGADVAHPGPGTNRPSIASLVFSWDRDATKYIALTDIQAPRLEMIENLQSLMKEALGVYFEKNNTLKRIIFYRDGVSEAEMDTVKSFEIAAVKAACKELWEERGFNPKDLPQLTFIVVVKRHHVIFVPKPNSDAVLDRKTGNCVAGLVVDRLRSPFSGGRDFFLQSHGAIQGTSRPGHYTVLEDECFGYNMPFLQQLSFELCHVYAKATRSVSIPAPVYYADLVCGRAKFHFDPNAGVDFDALFDWPWDSVASECVSVLGPAGYGYVQVSPATEHIQGSQWWTDYQTVSYKLESKRGTRGQFANMVASCKSAGVDVIVDVVFNHMSTGSGVGFAGSRYDKYDYPAVPYTSSNFHYCSGSSASQISDYSNAYNVQFCELAGLSDLAQEQPVVQSKIAAMLNDLLSLGVAGFRIDAAKHMVDADIASILSKLLYPFYDTQEVIYGQGEAVQPSQYVTSGNVIEFRATTSVLLHFTGSSGGIASLLYPTPMGSAWGFVDSSVATFIMANQDTERNGQSLTYTSPNNAYLLSAIFMLGYNYGTPTVYSGFNFSGFDDGAPQNSQGYTNTVKCFSNGWRCEHRWPAILNMVGFHNAVSDKAVTNVQFGNTQQLAFERNGTGFLIINNAGSTWSNTWSTTLPAGTYCDILHSDSIVSGPCSGPSYVVSSSGLFSASVAPYDGIALVIGVTGNGSPDKSASTVASPSPSPSANSVTVNFVETASSGPGDVIKVCGSLAQLGLWSATSAIALSETTSGWQLSMTLSPGTYFEYKFIRVSDNGAVNWESGSNRMYTTPSAGNVVTLYGAFGSTQSSSSAGKGSVSSTGQPPNAVGSTQAAASSASSTLPTSPTSTSTSTPPSSTAVTVNFVETASRSYGDTVKICGSISQLGSWDSSAALALSPTSSSSNGDWQLSTMLPPGTYFEYKFMRVSSGGRIGGHALWHVWIDARQHCFDQRTGRDHIVVVPFLLRGDGHFIETASAASAEVIKLVGSTSELGNWTPAAAVALSNSGNVWSVTLVLPANTAIQYKFIRVRGNTASWESDPNRSYTTLSAGSTDTLSSSFR
ncbi:unnamed protein product [Mycena citricolor]|uniref:alpha-amylase n=1 Tax=Mycena citricolor TaxID=2018698 RepID=A0AAD2HP80_9AGAR|nr:unnamed protein product [Mycena citricolor]